MVQLTKLEKMVVLVVAVVAGLLLLTPAAKEFIQDHHL
jgi:hypothetical protein